ncbi:protein phosphatase 2c-like protein 3 [Dermatophagoides farinae]|uniref:protein-serine/threonine phosphatase n=1 Tax=Dermatophagoides farinae TaxID=6954 RepID=A0A9D4P6I0_DERFA|nr:protein phosphatase 2c-like protein 3 [Dermatophagoides farinae]
MGQAFSEPVTEKESSTEKNDKFLVASSSIQGWRISMEDAHTILLTMPDDPEASFFAVFDGHGGAKVANYASENLHQGLCSHRLYQEGHIDEALKNIFVEFDEMMFNNEKMRDELAGSTAVVVLIKDHQIYCANIGDSRAVASFAGQVDPLSIDHKPTCEDEMNRIVSAGGWVQFNRVNGNLALSRAFGDFVFKRNEKRSATEQIVIAYPDIQTRSLTSDLEFIIMACDGVWDVMTNEEVVEFIRRRIFYRREPVAICEELITRCLAPDCQMGCGIGCDNMTMVLHMKNFVIV